MQGNEEGVKVTIRRLLFKLTPNFILDLIRPIAGYILDRVNYSRKFYEEDYHTKEYALQEQNLESLMKRFTDTGHKAKLLEALEQIKDLPTPKTWLEVGCQFGKSTFWIAEQYPPTVFYMFDFAQTAIDFVNKHNPIPERTVVWKGDASNIRYKANTFDNFFDIVSILDFTEHLPREIYHKTIAEAFRVLKPSGFLLLKQGNTIRPEHINIRWE